MIDWSLRLAKSIPVMPLKRSQDFGVPARLEAARQAVHRLRGQELVVDVLRERQVSAVRRRDRVATQKPIAKRTLVVVVVLRQLEPERVVAESSRRGDRGRELGVEVGPQVHAPREVVDVHAALAAEVTAQEVLQQVGAAGHARAVLLAPPAHEERVVLERVVRAERIGLRRAQLLGLQQQRAARDAPAVRVRADLLVVRRIGVHLIGRSAIGVEGPLGPTREAALGRDLDDAVGGGRSIECCGGRSLDDLDVLDLLEDSGRRAGLDSARRR